MSLREHEREFEADLRRVERMLDRIDDEGQELVWREIEKLSKRISIIGEAAHKSGATTPEACLRVEAIVRAANAFLDRESKRRSEAYDHAQLLAMRNAEIIARNIDAENATAVSARSVDSPASTDTESRP